MHLIVLTSPNYAYNHTHVILLGTLYHRVLTITRAVNQNLPLLADGKTTHTRNLYASGWTASQGADLCDILSQ